MTQTRAVDYENLDEGGNVINPALSRPLCHDHPTRRCTPDDCCQVVTSQHSGQGE